MTAIEIAIGVTSGFWFVVCCAAMIRTKHFPAYIEEVFVANAAVLGTVWFAARLWGFA